MQTTQIDNSCAHYDLIIIGGGCSGLSLAAALCRLARQPEHVPSTLIIEPRPCYADDRSWCFWEMSGQSDLIEDKLIVKSWRSWEFSTSSISHRQTSGSGWAYNYVPSIRFYDYAEREISRNQNITLLKSSRVTYVNPQHRHIEVHFNIDSKCTEHQIRKVKASQVIDTRIPVNVEVSSASLKQIFYGFEVRTDSPHQHDDVAHVMKDMRVDNEGFMFDYVLPISRNSLLVEFTRFSEKSLSKENLRTNALESLRRVCGSSGYEIVREESGVIPMGLRSTASSGSPRWIYAGLGAGAARPSTGYAFKRIQRWAEQCAAGILNEGPEKGFPSDKVLLMWMDAVFLRTIASNPTLAPQLFMALASNVSTDRFLRFLTDRPSSGDLLAIILALPKLTLIRSALIDLLARVRKINGSQIWRELL